MARNIYTDWGRVPLLLTLEEAGLLLRVTPECVRVLCVKGRELPEAENLIRAAKEMLENMLEDVRKDAMQERYEEM